MAKFFSIVLLFLVGCPDTEVTPISLIALVSEIQAQAQLDRRAEAERLLNLCPKHLGKQQFEAAIQSCQQAVKVQQQISDRLSESSL